MVGCSYFLYCLVFVRADAAYLRDARCVATSRHTSRRMQASDNLSPATAMLLGFIGAQPTGHSLFPYGPRSDAALRFHWITNQFF